MPAPFVMHAVGDATIVVLEEASILDAIHVQEIGDALYHLVDGRACRRVILDLAKVRVLSSSMLGVLIEMRKKVDAIGGRIILCGVREDLMKVFTLTHLHKLFDFCADEQEALAALGLTTAG